MNVNLNGPSVVQPQETIEIKPVCMSPFLYVLLAIFLCISCLDLFVLINFHVLLNINILIINIISLVVITTLTIAGLFYQRWAFILFKAVLFTFFATFLSLGVFYVSEKTLLEGFSLNAIPKLYLTVSVFSLIFLLLIGKGLHKLVSDGCYDSQPAPDKNYNHLIRIFLINAFLLGIFIFYYMTIYSESVRLPIVQESYFAINGEVEKFNPLEDGFVKIKPYANNFDTRHDHNYANINLYDHIIKKRNNGFMITSTGTDLTDYIKQNKKYIQALEDKLSFTIPELEKVIAQYKFNYPYVLRSGSTQLFQSVSIDGLQNINENLLALAVIKTIEKNPTKGANLVLSSYKILRTLIDSLPPGKLMSRYVYMIQADLDVLSYIISTKSIDSDTSTRIQTIMHKPFDIRTIKTEAFLQDFKLSEKTIYDIDTVGKERKILFELPYTLSVFDVNECQTMLRNMYKMSFENLQINYNPEALFTTWIDKLFIKYFDSKGQHRKNYIGRFLVMPTLLPNSSFVSGLENVEEKRLQLYADIKNHIDSQTLESMIKKGSRKY